ncbi:MAG TPA: hypothetical protein ENN09_03050, partial [Planctomycetes bacterium]|nr:hypothetical protein [Planctomycetota bacterium]
MNEDEGLKQAEKRVPAHLTPGRWAAGMATAGGAALVFLAIAVLVGSVIPWHRVLAFWTWDATERGIILQYRLPR